MGGDARGAGTMRRIAFVAILLAACSNGRPALTHEPPPPSGAMRVMSYNVNFGLAGDPAGVAAVGDARPDIVLLQETNRAWEAAFVHGLGDRYPHHRFTEPEGWPAGGMGILSRFPIVSIDQLPSHGGPFFAWRVVLDSPLGRIQLLNVHLRPPMSDSGSWVVGYFSTREDREREIEYHLAALDPKLPTMILGDFNEEGDGRAVSRIKNLGYADAIDEHNGNKRTWEWPVSGFTLKFQLDHILHDDHFVAIASAIVEAGRSDHKPVWADFERIDP
ncbi:MAG: Endonuclease/Exonuclease/phosphatase family protein [Myxococcales bacterium]|nr:Endonuclease/Exonuclease/phosphatase family protein [Myxococcales bacterium]